MTEQSHSARVRLHALRDCLTDRQEHGMPYRWGIVLHSGGSVEWILATTLGGEVLVLTRGLAGALAGRDLYLGGRTPARVTPELAPDGRTDDDRPVEHLVLSVAVRTGWAAVGATVLLDSTVDAITLSEAPLVLLAPARPRAWPP
jgi:hypothetical protein